MSIRKIIHLGLAVIALTCCLGAQYAVASVTVTVQPQAPVSNVGSNQALNAQITATGGETITGYAWKTNNQAPFYTIPGATNSSYTITNVQTSDAGYYFVSVTYNSGTNFGLTAVSTVATLTVHDQARLTSQPSGLIRATGAGAAFNASATGALPITYHWRDNGTNLADGGRITGSATSSLSITGLLTTDTGGYDLMVSNAYGVATSQVATLSVYQPPFVSVQPANLTILVSNTAVLSVTPGGTPPFNFQWKKGFSILSNGGRISGANSNVLTITGALTNDNGNYTVSFSNPVGSATSLPATLTVLIPPLITSPTNAFGQQGFFFNYQATANGSAPITWGAQGLPTGLSVVSSNGLISGVPLVSGDFNVTLFATNAAAIASTNLLLSLITDVPGITSSLSASGQQGQFFFYAITASNNPVIFSAVGLPPGIDLDPVAGILFGPSLLSGTFPVTIGAANQFGADSQVLTLTLASAVPVITSVLTASGTENQSNFAYNITANNSPTLYGAVGLPVGLTLNTNTGRISGTLFVGGTNNVLITAANAYGVGSNTLSLRVAYTQLPGLAITDVTNTYSSPYLLDFTFSLRDDPNATNNSSLGNAVVRPPEQVQVLCMEGDTNQNIGVPIPNETAFIVNRALSTVGAKKLKTYFVLDYTYSMYIAPGAITNMQAAVEGLINEEPPSAQFGVFEFSADYLPPQLVTDFTADKTALTKAIEGIQTNFVQGNYAGSRFYDALNAALMNFNGSNPDELRYLVVMSDGNDDSSILGTTTNNPTQASVIVSLAQSKMVKIYCVGFGPSPNVPVLQQLTTQTQGHYYAAASASALSAQFGLLLKDLNSQYLLRWATLQRSPNAFQPMFQVTVGGVSASYNTGFNTVTNPATTNTMVMPPVTNPPTVMNVSLSPFYNPTTWAGNVQVGALSLIADAMSNASSVTLRATYVPRFVREFQIHYRPNYPCTPSLLSAGPGDILFGWSLTQTNDGAGGQWLTIASPNTNNSQTSIPYGVFGDLASFQFKYQALPTGQQAFSFFNVDNTVYPKMPPSGQSFTLTNTNVFVMNYPALTLPHGTPLPWLFAYGYTNTNTLAAVENSISSNGLPVWQDYIAGLVPTNANPKFIVLPIKAPQPGQPPVITFNTALGRIYRVDSATALGAWLPLLDGIAGTGGPVSVPDNRDLSGVSGQFYRVVVFY